MNRYIDADRAIEEARLLYGDVHDAENMERFLKAQPAADVAPVVHCKDCKYSRMYCFGSSNIPTLACCDVEDDGFICFARSTNPDGFCSVGAKMDGDENE